MFRVIVLAVALIAGGIAAYLALNLGSGEPGQTVVELAPQITTQEVLVATRDIGQGQALSEENLRWQRWPEEAVNAAFISRTARPDAIETVKGSVVRSQFVAGEPIRESKLARPESGFMSAILPEGKRAVAVRVSAQNTAGGFILPNDRVDVIQTVTQPGSQDGQNETVSRTILTNMRVLAIDQTVEESGGEPVVVGKTATLEVDPVQAEIITAAEASGTLSLSLRAMADTDEASASNQRQSGTVKIYRSGRGQIVKTQ
ncbi:Flp pilus assembly protein CpaB [Faunimonas sp. B44]|uniref:Flp pilus assembly protein CpaB n=1 Tax=Faunimonas sp. B44 TaxID=3461493 RepID=UPI004044BA38